MSYCEQLFDARLYAEKRFLEDYPEAKEVMDKTIDFFTIVTNKLDSIEFAEEKIQYKLLLIVSFMRTHYVINELITYSEIIEASTLMRKQLELIARLKEIDVNELERLDKKVPQMKQYYGLWSQVAHNASFDSLDMLGFNMEDENHKRFYVQPSYTDSTIEAFDMNIGLFMMFAMEVSNFMEKVIPDYKPIEEMKFVLSLNEYGSKTNIPYFKSLKGMKVRYQDEA